MREIELPGDVDIWYGFRRHSFSHAGRQAYIVRPECERSGRPWVWRARFFGAWPQADCELLQRGFHLAYIDVVNLYGCPVAVELWDRFYELLIQQFGFAPKPVLEGFSRGGLIVYNWAARNSNRVSCLYADAPVCDIRSWPGGYGRGCGSPADWQRCLAAYGLTEAEAATFQDNPVDHLEALATAGVPLLHVCGDADEAVPIEENTFVLRDRYRALGGSIELILKPGCGHHPHSLDPPDAIVAFILRHAIVVEKAVQPGHGAGSAGG